MPPRKNRTPRKNRKKGLRCQICSKSLVETIDESDFDPDETEDDVGIKLSVGGTAAKAIFTDAIYQCAGCKRSGAGAPPAPPPPTKAEEEEEARVWEDPKKVKSLVEKQAARALKDAADLDEIEELEEQDELVDEILKNTRVKADVITTDDLDREKRRESW